MASEIDLLQGLLQQARDLPLRDGGLLDALMQRSEMLVRRIFGDDSSHLHTLRHIQFRPIWGPTNAVEDREAWETGQTSLVNLVNTMIEERQLFDSDPTPVLTIQDEELRFRTSDLLSAPDRYDRVVREATTILEDRIRRKVAFEDLIRIMPVASDQTGDTLINKLFGGKDPILVTGDRHKQIRLLRMLGGAVSYLRNPSHHAINDRVEWSWAWSVVGLVDQLLADVDACSVTPPDPSS